MEKESKINYLLAFDLDDTILEKGSMYEACALLPKEEYYTVAGKYYNQWFDKMQAILTSLAINGIKISEIKNTIQEIPLVTSIIKVLNLIKVIKDHQSQNIHVDFIIITGSVYYFAEWMAEKHDMTDYVDKILAASCTNDRNNKELINLTPYHKHNCNQCESFLCKRKALEDYVTEKRIIHNIVYDKIAFFGDGDNDLCAGIALSKVQVKMETHFCVRNGYVLFNILFDKDKNINQDYKDQINSKILIWDDGEDIYDHLVNKFFDPKQLAEILGLKLSN